jgi:hypothetical protein
MLDYESSDDESKEVCAAEFTWLPNDKANTCASLKPAHKSQDEMKFTFDVAKCDKIFDDSFKSGKIKMSHTIPPIDQLKDVLIVNFIILFLMLPMIAILFVEKYNRPLTKVV